MMKTTELVLRFQIKEQKPQRSRSPEKKRLQRRIRLFSMKTTVTVSKISVGISKSSNNLKAKRAKNFGDCRIDFKVTIDSKLIQGSWKKTVMITKMRKNHGNTKINKASRKMVMILKRMKVTNGNGN